MEWIVAEPGISMTRLCSEPVIAEPTSLVFERIEVGEAEDDLPGLLAANAREVVNFEWNAATGELSYRTTTTTRIFSDLEHSSSQGASPAGRNCGSR